jgi:hypothetical protein
LFLEAILDGSVCVSRIATGNQAANVATPSLPIVSVPSLKAKSLPIKPPTLSNSLAFVVTPLNTMVEPMMVYAPCPKSSLLMPAPASTLPPPRTFRISLCTPRFIVPPNGPLTISLPVPVLKYHRHCKSHRGEWISTAVASIVAFAPRLDCSDFGLLPTSQSPLSGAPQPGLGPTAQPLVTAPLQPIKQLLQGQVEHRASRNGQPRRHFGPHQGLGFQGRRGRR